MIRSPSPWMAVGASLLAGCTVGPDYVRPAYASLGVPAAFGERSASTSTPATTVAAEWWMGLSDPELDRLVSLALDANTDIAAAAARLRISHALARQAAGARLPTLGASASIARTVGAPIVSTGFVTDGAPETIAIGGDATTFQAGLNASWDADLFGGLRRNAEATRADLAAAGFTLRDAQASVVAEIASAYLDLRSAQARLAIASAQLVSQRRSAEIVGWRVQAGLASRGDYESVLALREQTAALLPVFEEAARLSVHRIGVLSGRAPSSEIRLLATAAPVPTPHELPDVGIPARMLERRPDVLAAERSLAAETARIGVRTAELYPALTLSGTFGGSSASLAALPSAAFANLLASLTAPLFQGGRIRAGIDAQRAQTALAFANYRAAILGALEDVENAVASTRTNDERRRHLAAAVDAATTALVVARGRYRSGLTDFQTLLNAERTQLTARDGEALAQSSRAHAMVRLFRALGGGWNP